MRDVRRAESPPARCPAATAASASDAASAPRAGDIRRAPSRPSDGGSAIASRPRARAFIRCSSANQRELVGVKAERVGEIAGRGEREDTEAGGRPVDGYHARLGNQPPADAQAAGVRSACQATPRRRRDRGRRRTPARPPDRAAPLETPPASAVPDFSATVPVHAPRCRAPPAHAPPYRRPSTDRRETPAPTPSLDGRPSEMMVAESPTVLV